MVFLAEIFLKEFIKKHKDFSVQLPGLIFIPAIRAICFIQLPTYTLPMDQQFNLEFQFKSVFKLVFQPEFGIQLGIPIPMGINLGECRSNIICWIKHCTKAFQWQWASFTYSIIANMPIAFLFAVIFVTVSLLEFTQLVSLLAHKRATVLSLLRHLKHLKHLH